MNVKRFLLFSGQHYYPAGGWCDLRGSFDTLEEAKQAFAELNYDRDWYQIVDITTGEEVEGS